MHYIWSYKCSESVKSLANRDSSSWCDDKRSYEVRDVGTMCCCVGPFGGESEGPMSMKGGLRSEVKGRLWNTNCPFNVLILIWDKFDSNRNSFSAFKMVLTPDYFAYAEEDGPGAETNRTYVSWRLLIINICQWHKGNKSVKEMVRV